MNLVSVIIPVYNRADLLRRALNSVAAQSWRPIEAIVVDDGSTENIAEVVSDFSGIATLVRQENAGVTAARNRGMKEAKGEFIAFLDSDDYWDADKVSAQVALLRARPELLMVWTDMRAVDESNSVQATRYLRTFYCGSYDRIDKGESMPLTGTLQSLAPQCPQSTRDFRVRIGDIFPDMLYGNVVHTSTALFRRERLIAGGGFDPGLARSGEDYEFHWRTCFFGPAALIDEPLISYRVGAGDQLTSAEWSYERGINALTTVKYWVGAAGEKMNQAGGRVRDRLAELESECGERRVLNGQEGGLPHLIKSLRLKPLWFRTWVLFALAALPGFIRHPLLSIWRSRPRLNGRHA